MPEQAGETRKSLQTPATAAAKSEVAPAQGQHKRVIAFFDCQNIFFAAKELWGYTWVNFDPRKLATEVCATRAGWNLVQTRFYTGIPQQARDYKGNMFWQNKLRALSRDGVVTFKRNIEYRSENIEFNDGSIETITYGVTVSAGIL